jgi:LPS sulfotransferase NodH
MPAYDDAYAAAFPGGAAIDREALLQLGVQYRLYAMFIIARSGSTWLTELARGSGVLGCPQEWLEPGFCLGLDVNLDCPPPRVLGINEINAYLQAVAKLSAAPNRVAGIQLSWPQLESLSAKAPAPLPIEAFQAVFYLRRKDVLAQAVSLYRSSASGRFHSFQNAADLVQRFDEVAFNADQIIALLAHLLDCERGFEACFAARRIEPIRLYYEDFAEDPTPALTTMAAQLGVDGPIPIAPSRVTRLSDATNANWIERLRRDHAAAIDALITDRA